MMTQGYTEPPVPTTTGQRPMTTEERVAQIESGAPPAGTGAPPSAADQEPMIYVGHFPAYEGDDTPRGYGSQTTGTGPANLVPISVLIDSFEDMERWQQKQMALLLTLGGYNGDIDFENVREAVREMNYVRLRRAYEELLNDAAARTSSGQMVTPENLLIQAVSYRLGEDWNGRMKDLKEILADRGIKLAPEKDEEAYDGPQTNTSSYSNTNTSTDSSTEITRSIMDPDDAMALTRGLMQQELGRDPTKEEMEDFIATLQHASRTNPTRTTSNQSVTTTNSGSETTVSDDDGRGHGTTSSTSTSNSDTDRTGSTTTHQGIGAAGLQDRALRKVRQNPDWAEWQAVGTYTPALFQALGATVPGV